MQPIGGVILSCVLIAERPRVICEVVFESREGAENVVETFHGQNVGTPSLKCFWFLVFRRCGFVDVERFANMKCDIGRWEYSGCIS